MCPCAREYLSDRLNSQRGGLPMRISHLAIFGDLRENRFKGISPPRRTQGRLGLSAKPHEYKQSLVWLNFFFFFF